RPKVPEPRSGCQRPAYPNTRVRPASGQAPPGRTRAWRRGDTGEPVADNARMFDVILHQPEIPPNTGNVIRLCANTGARLHLVRPLGFDLDDRHLRRAGLDYREYAPVQVHDALAEALARIAPERVFAVSTRGSVRYDRPRYLA